MTLLPWPEPDDFKTEIESGAKVWMDGDQHAYERARAEAALQRLRVAVEALQAIGESYLAPRGDVAKALEQIGDIPE
jgi:hypothetical protein